MQGTADRVIKMLGKPRNYGKPLNFSEVITIHLNKYAFPEINKVRPSCLKTTIKRNHPEDKIIYPFS